MNSPSGRRVACLGLAAGALLPALAWAHPEGHGAHNAIAGFLHPFTGLDHLLAMIAVGLWATRLGRRAVWTLPAIFPVAMLVGAALVPRAITLPAIEPMIAVSVIVLGVLVAAGVRLPEIASSALVAVFALFHGYAHASEGPSTQIVVYAIGFVGATVILHAIGIAAGMWTARHDNEHGRAMNGLAGIAIAAVGAAILLG